MDNWDNRYQSTPYNMNQQPVHVQPAPPPIGIAVPVQVSPGFVHYGPKAQQVICPSCHMQVVSRVTKEATTKTHMSAVILCCCLCWPCACCPYCMDSCQNINHYCPNCTAYIGTYRN